MASRGFSFRRTLAAVSVAALTVAATSPMAAAQTVSARPSAAAAIPRTSDGRPDFHGMWSSQWLTPVERPASAKTLVLDKAEAARLTKEILARAEAGNPLDPELAYPDAASLAIVRGEVRSSLVIDPPDGRLPWTDAGRAAARKYVGGLDGPETRMTTERCIGGVGWAPLQIRSASMLHRIVQTSAHVVVQTEAYDDTRILPVDGKHRPSAVALPGGDSVARWDGDALVVETRHLEPETSTHGIVTVMSPDAVITERFELAGPDELVYRYTITDPAYYSKPWTAEYSMVRTSEKMFEFACHEGNYSMAGMLHGARAEQKLAVK